MIHNSAAYYLQLWCSLAHGKCVPVLVYVHDYMSMLYLYVCMCVCMYVCECAHAWLFELLCDSLGHIEPYHLIRHDSQSWICLFFAVCQNFVHHWVHSETQARKILNSITLLQHPRYHNLLF